jgi:hypothetical protein
VVPSVGDAGRGSSLPVSTGRDLGPGWLGESHGPGGHLFDPRMVLGHPEFRQEVGPLGTPGPWTC